LVEADEQVKRLTVLDIEFTAPSELTSLDGDRPALGDKFNGLAHGQGDGAIVEGGGGVGDVGGELELAARDGGLSEAGVEGLSGLSVDLASGATRGDAELVASGLKGESARGLTACLGLVGDEDVLSLDVTGVYLDASELLFDFLLEGDDVFEDLFSVGGAGEFIEIALVVALSVEDIAAEAVGLSDVIEQLGALGELIGFEEEGGSLKVLAAVELSARFIKALLGEGELVFILRMGERRDDERDGGDEAKTAMR
jgi:hypothetical protein